eukprot:12199520-Karenia_brevis.AAC.1
MEQWHRSSYGVLIAGSRILALSYADDIFLVSQGTLQLEEMVRSLKEQLASGGLHLSTKPSKNLVME